jgi:hypothetical protein
MERCCKNIASAIYKVTKRCSSYLDYATKITTFVFSWCFSEIWFMIIDEASQCDISFEFGFFFVAKYFNRRWWNQTSVVCDRSLFTIDRTNELLDKYLISHRFKNTVWCQQ